MRLFKFSFLVIVALALTLFLGAWKDQYSDMTIAVTQNPDTTSIDVVGDSIDTMGYNSIVICATIGSSALPAADSVTTAKYIEFEVEECSGNGSWSDVADAHLTNYVAGTNDGCIGLFDAVAEQPSTVYAQYLGSKRYIRLAINATGDFDANQAPHVSGYVIRTNAKYKPVTH